MTESERPRVLISDRVVFGGGANGREVAPGWIRIRGSLIDGAGRFGGEDRCDVLKSPDVRGAEILDFGSRLISPAFVNAHTHLALGFLRGAPGLASAAGNMVTEEFFRIEERLSGDDVRAFARMGAYESLLHGVACVWDHYYFGEQVAEALLDVGLGGVVAPTLQDIAGPGRRAPQEQLAATESIAASTRLREHGIFAAVGPHATDTVSGDLWREAADLASRLEIPLHAHLAQSLEETQAARERADTTPTGWLHAEGLLQAAPRNLLAHCLFLSRADLALLDAQRDHPVFCPYSQLLFAFPARPDRWEARGLEWVIATDCSASNDSFNVQKELRFVAAQRTAGVSWSREAEAFFETGGISEATAMWERRVADFEDFAPAAETDRLLDLVWSRPGGLHPAVRVGTLEAGALANISIWDVDHPCFWPDREGLRTLALGDTTQALHALFVAGRSVGEAGRFHQSLVKSGAYAEALLEANDRLEALLDD